MMHFHTVTANINTQVNTTISGRPCQRWDSQSPHIHSYFHFSAFENYCMNPNEDVAPWCYTTDKHLRSEFCPLPVTAGKLFYVLFDHTGLHM